MMADKFPAKIDGFSLIIETIEDSVEKSIAKYEFPFRNGALLEDMGQKARVIKIKCYFYEETYEEHINFLNHLQNRSLIELSHPKYGIIKGCVEAVSVRHDDRIRSAEIDITFAESLPAPRPVHAPGVHIEVEESYTTGQQEAMEEFRQDVSDALGTDADEILDRELDPSTGILDQFQDLAAEIRDYVAPIDEFVTTFEETLIEVANPANSLVATIEYAVNLPGRVIGSIARMTERYSLLYDTAKNAPARFVQSFLNGIAELRNSLPRTSSKSKAVQSAVTAMQKHVQIASAQRVSLDVAYLYKDDETNRQKQKRIEQVKSFDQLGNYFRRGSSGRIMTINDIEKTVAAVRTELQTAVDSARSVASLKDMARQLLFHVNTIKLEREKIRQIEVDTVMPLHLVCLKNGLPYNYAARIHAINSIKNPNFTSGQVNIYAG